MEYNLASNLTYCYQFFIDSKGLLLYTHIPPIALALFFGIYVVFKKRDVLGLLLLGVAVAFSAFAVLDLLQWIIIDRNTDIMSSWSVLGLLSVLLFFLTHWFTHRFITGSNLPFWMMSLWAIAFVPIIFLTPTGYNLSGYDIRDCVAVEGGLFTNYYYSLGVFSMVLMFVSWFTGRRKKTDNEKTYQNASFIVLLGSELFTLSFLVTGVVASYLVDAGYLPDFGLGNYGIAAMAVFIGVLAYATVRYQAFNIKLLGTQALVITLGVLVGAEFLFVQNSTNEILVGLTLLLVVCFGWVLVRSVKREIEQREHIEKLAQDLEETNKRQETLIHFVGHEVKGFLTKDQGVFASLVEGDFGALGDNLKPFVANALTQTRTAVRSVTDILAASNLKKGTTTFTMAPFDLKDLVKEAVEKSRSMAEQKGLALSFSADEQAGPYTAQGDRNQIGDHVFRNLIDNSINYTPTGKIEVTLKKESNKIIFAVHDTGVGIDPEDGKRLFTEGGHGKESIKINVHSTGYGLFIAKNIVVAHKGTIRAESDGPGKGSTFIVELPA